jgi:hypothetical protein
MFGLQGHKVTHQDIKQLDGEKVELVYLERDIRRSNIPATPASMTQGSLVLSQIV